MSASFTIICSWLKLSWSITGLSILSRSVLSPTLNLLLSWQEHVWQLSGTFSVFVSITSLLVLSCAFSTLGSLLSSDERAWITVVSKTGLPVLSEETGSSWKELTPISWERDVFLPSCTVLASSLITGFSVLSRIGLRIGWFDWKLLDSCPTSDRWARSEPNSLWWRPRWHVYFFVHDFSIFHPNNFRNTTKLEVFLEEWLHSIESDRIWILAQ